MPLVTRIRHLGAFALVEANNRLFIDGQAHTPNNLAPIAFDKLGAISAISTQETAFSGDPLFSLPRSMLVMPYSTRIKTDINPMFDSTINVCGKNIGFPGIRYDVTDKRYMVANKTRQNVEGGAWSLKVYDNSFDLMYESSLPTAGDPIAGQSAIFIEPKSKNVQFLVTQQTLVNSSGAAPEGAASRIIKFDAAVSTAPTSVAQCAGWFQVVHKPPDSAGQYLIVVPSYLLYESSRARFMPVMAINQDTGLVKELGTASPKTDETYTLDELDPQTGEVITEGIAYFKYSDTYGCLASNAEYIEQSGSGNDSVFFYTMRTNSDYLTSGREHDRKVRRSWAITVCKVADLNTESPVLAASPCTYTPQDFNLLTDIPSKTRRFRPFIFRDAASGTDYLGIVSYETGTSTLSIVSQNIYVFRIGGAEKNELTFLQKVPIGNIGAVRGAMPMDSSMKKWLICYVDKTCIYQWNPATNFTLQSTQDVQPQWVGIDSLGRTWIAESETLSLIFGDGQKLYYYPSSGTAVALQASFQASSYTFSGTPINSNIVINAYDLSGSRTSISIMLNLEGSNVTFADGSTQKQLTTSSNGDTLVPIIVRSTGLLRATITEAV